MYQTKTIIDADTVCPECYRSVPGAAVLPARQDRYGRRLRSYFGSCLNCKSEFEVIQFKIAGRGRWSIHMFRFYVAKDAKNLAGPWRTLKELPDPAAPVLTGPGGDFDREIRIDSVAFLERGHNALQSLTASFRNLIKAARRAKEIDDGTSPL